MPPTADHSPAPPSANGHCRVDGCDCRAATIGLCRRHYSRMTRGESIGLWRDNRKWLPWEENFILEHLSRLGYVRTAAALGRGLWAVQLHCKRDMGIGIKSVDGGYTRNQAERMLGLPDKTLLDWHKHGLEWRRIASFTGGRGRRGQMHIILPEEIGRFLAAHPEACDWTKLPRMARVRFGVDGLARPRSKIVVCSLGHRNRVPLDGLHLCRRCGRRMTPWAEAYSDEEPEAFAPRPPTRDEVSYYDPATDTVRCLVCGERFQTITAGHVRRHGYGSQAEYFEAHGYHPRSPVASRHVGRLIARNWGRNRDLPAHQSSRRLKRPPWTPADLERLRRDYPSGPVAALAEAMGRSERALHVKARELGLRRALP